MPAAVKTKPIVPTIQVSRQPMPVGGLNWADNVMALGPEYAYVLDNFIPRTFGTEVRKGWRYWMPQANNFAGPVRTIFVYNGRTPTVSKLFVAPGITGSPIYDVTITNAAPVLGITPATPTLVLGEYYYTNFSTPGGSFLVVVGAGAGYMSYNSVGGWVQYVVGDGVVPNTLKFPDLDGTLLTDLCYVWAWKNRLWFLKKDSTVAYYLPISQVYGILTAFDFGSQMQEGGALSFGTNWTYDGGQGMDDSLIIVTTEGEVLVYQGTDPASINTFSLKGVWFAGRPPYGRRGHHAHGGDVLMVTEYGIIRMTDLVSGKLQQADLSYNSLAGKVNPRLARFISETRENEYWFILPYPTEELVIVGSPYIDPDLHTRTTFVMNSLGNNWSTFSRLDLLSAEMWQGDMIFGTRAGAIGQAFTSFRDGDSSDGTTPGNNIVGALQTNFNAYESPTQNKTVMRGKIYGIVLNAPSLVITYLDEFNFVISNYPATPGFGGLGALWDAAIWDSAIWDAASGSLHKWIGTAAFGKKMALQLVIQVNSQTILTDYETAFKKGNGL